MQSGVDLFKTSSFVYMSLPQRLLLKINIACPVCLRHGRGIGHRLELSSGGGGGAFPKDTIYLLSKYLPSKMGGGRAFQGERTV